MAGAYKAFGDIYGEPKGSFWHPEAVTAEIKKNVLIRGSTSDTISKTKNLFKVTPMKHKSKILLVLFSLMLLIGIMLPVLTACDPGHDIIIENGTEETLTIYFDVGPTGYFVTLGNLEPSEHIYASITMMDGYCQIDARNAEGDLIFSREYDWWELRDDMGWMVVIMPPEED